MQALVRSDAAQQSFRQMRPEAIGSTMLIGVDRVDYTKGLPYKFDAWEQFLTDNPRASR